MELAQALLAGLAAAIASGYALCLTSQVEQARQAVGGRALTSTLRRAHYQIAQQMPVDIIQRVAADAGLLPNRELTTDVMDEIYDIAGERLDALDALRRVLAEGWHMVTQPAITVPDNAEEFQFDALVEGPGRRI